MGSKKRKFAALAVEPVSEPVVPVGVGSAKRATSSELVKAVEPAKPVKLAKAPRGKVEESAPVKKRKPSRRRRVAASLRGLTRKKAPKGE